MQLQVEAMQRARGLVLPCQLTVIVASLVVLLALLMMYWPSIHEELVLQFQCHLNDSSLAQENTRLALKIEELRNEVDALGEEKKQCLNDNDMEHSAANRSFWEGVMVCVSFQAAIGVLLFCCCYRFMSLFHAPQVRQRRRVNWVAIR